MLRGSSAGRTRGCYELEQVPRSLIMIRGSAAPGTCTWTRACGSVEPQDAVHARSAIFCFPPGMLSEVPGRLQKLLRLLQSRRIY